MRASKACQMKRNLTLPVAEEGSTYKELMWAVARMARVDSRESTVVVSMTSPVSGSMTVRRGVLLCPSYQCGWLDCLEEVGRTMNLLKSTLKRISTRQGFASNISNPSPDS